MQYPVSRTVDQSDVFFGVMVQDPYRWLEDSSSPDVRTWIDAQNAVTFSYLCGLPERDRLRGRLTALWNYERFGLPGRRGGNYFYSRNDGLQNQGVYYVAPSLDSEPRVLLDPNTLSTDGTVALSGIAISDDGSLIAYALSSAGSDWQTWRVRDVATGVDRPDLVEWTKFTGAAWVADNSGFFYSRFDAPPQDAEFSQINTDQKLYFHKLGTSQDDDTLIYARPDQPLWGIGGSVSDDNSWLEISLYLGTDPRNGLYLKSLTTPDTPVTPLFEPEVAAHSIIGNDGDTFYVRTDRDAPRGKVVAVDRHHPEPENWRVVVPETADTLEGASLFGDTLILNYLRDVKTWLVRCKLDGTLLGEIALPGIGTAGGFGGRRDVQETFYAFSSFTAPTSIWRYDLTSGESSVFKTPKVDVDASLYITEQLFATSRDGTRVPMFVTRRRDVTPSGDCPVFLSGYGGFTVSVTPGFSVPAAAWMEMGGLYAVANLRGGGEYGDDWYKAGTKLQKQNVFDDFIACAERLISSGWSRAGRIAIAGGSNGGLLVGACANQRPDLFGAALPAVGVMDMVRFAKFTIGFAWASDYGSVENEDEFRALFAYSPYHNLRPGSCYPATLVTTSDHDDRVVPAHSFKYTAALQAVQAPECPPTLIRIETRAGHGAGKPISKIIEEQADILAFAWEALGAHG